MANNFESGTLSGFSVNTSGTGTASVSSAKSHDGACSAYLHVTTDSGSMANFSTPLPSGSQEVYADGWFNIAVEGVSGNNVPYFRFFNGNTRYIDVYRENVAGTLWLRVLAPDGVTYNSTSLGRTVPLNSWHRLVTHVIPNGSATTVEIWFDDSEIYSSTQVNINTTSLTRVQNGAEHPQQMGDEYIDDLIIKSLPSSSSMIPGGSVAITPTRFLDTRTSSGPVPGGGTVSFQAAGVNGVPSNASAVVVNLTVTQPQAAGFLTAYASGATKPSTSNVNYGLGQTVPNLAVVPVGPDGKVTIANTSSGSTQVIADVSAYYTGGTPSAAGAFSPLAPTRFLDTRTSSGPVAAGGTVSFQAGGANGIPANASAVVVNLTVTQPTSNGFLTAYASGAAKPGSSNVNYGAGQTVPNLAVVPVGPDGKVTIANTESAAGSSTQVVADVSGYFLPGAPTDSGAFGAITPTRFLDTRTSSGPVPAGGTVSFQAAGVNGVPANIAGVWVNLTVTQPTSFGYLTGYASGSSKPGSSNVNYGAGQTIPNMAYLPVGPDGKVTIANTESAAGSSVQVIADVSGYQLK